MARRQLIQVRRDTAANWTSANPTLASGEVGFETNTLKFKIGNGSTAWNSLSYGSAGTATTATALATARNIDGQSFDGTADITVIAPGTHAATGKATPVDADEVPLVDSADSHLLKKLTWANLKATLKTYFDGLYPSGSGASSGTNTGDQTTVSGNAGSATVLATSRNINGIAFNGSANISVPAGIFVTGFGTGLAAAADLYFAPGTTLGGSGTLVQRQVAVSAGTISNLRVHTGATQSATGSLVVKVWVNGSASSLTATVTAGGTAGTYDSGATTVSVSAGDLLAVEVINNASVTSTANVLISFYLQ